MRTTQQAHPAGEQLQAGTSFHAVVGARPQTRFTRLALVNTDGDLERFCQSAGENCAQLAAKRTLSVVVRSFHHRQRRVFYQIDPDMSITKYGFRNSVVIMMGLEDRERGDQNA